MRFWSKACIYVFCVAGVIVFACSAFANADLAVAKGEVSTLFKKVQSELYRVSPPSDQRVIEEVQLEISNAVNPLGAWTERTGERRYIHLTTGFLSWLYNFVLAAQLERHLSIEALSEQVVYESAFLLAYENFRFDVFEFAGYVPKDVRQEVLQAVSRDFLMALIPVIAHEIGHHVINGFYDENTPDYQKRQIEDQVDQ